ncbi:hypothetical protein BJ741DRAFT_687266 [Chytriomyces cf. hyalinus JEL632]|nr:hypothetical protein BJ741DRAFT_687266 [Chytriomyces cf. hyalinus JEL632]
MNSVCSVIFLAACLASHASALSSDCAASSCLASSTSSATMVPNTGDITATTLNPTSVTDGSTSITADLQNPNGAPDFYQTRITTNPSPPATVFIPEAIIVTPPPVPAVDASNPNGLPSIYIPSVTITTTDSASVDNSSSDRPSATTAANTSISTAEANTLSNEPSKPASATSNIYFPSASNPASFPDNIYFPTAPDYSGSAGKKYFPSDSKNTASTTVFEKTKDSQAGSITRSITPTPMEKTECSGIMHAIQAGDYCSTIAEKYGASVSDLVYVNQDSCGGENRVKLQVGDTLCIVSHIADGEGPSMLAGEVNTADFLKKNACSGGHVDLALAGATCEAIARKYELELGKVEAANVGLCAVMEVADAICIPGK